jgi:hypothetical protein
VQRAENRVVTWSHSQAGGLVGDLGLEPFVAFQLDGLGQALICPQNPFLCLMGEDLTAPACPDCCEDSFG